MASFPRMSQSGARVGRPPADLTQHDCNSSHTFQLQHRVSLRPSSGHKSQSGASKGAGPPERQNLIGDGHTDWMTEKVDLSSFVSTTTGSSPRSPPSPLQHHVKVPSDLEVMTSLLQEELAQLEDYFRSESSSTSAKLDRSSKCDKGAPGGGSQSYYQLPYASYAPSEPSPVGVSLASGELDLTGFCGSPVGEEAGPDTWGSRGGYSGSADLSLHHYSTLKPVGKSPAGVKKEEESYCFSEGMFCSEEIARGFCHGGSGSSYGDHRREQGPSGPGSKPGGGYDAGGSEVLDGGLSGGALAQETMGVSGDGYYHQAAGGSEPYHSFIGGSVKRRSTGSTGTGERKQKKRDQNKTAAHRYRLRKRAELDSLEEELHGLEGQNRELRDKAESVEREIQYVKDLLIEVYKARSQRLKQDAAS
ncbi:hypothetical protein NHX12_007891 [Muraenolepis orangiensis]|uniref:BZIP domain-containing protein n=1 Tax=Muraenolepis orangiensis TaxID=630683 RepID=A0A9Q0DK88_9TELE|nr:hypothetical protein NHX12_007891 [Muraenolepis orangiensis]